MGVGKNGKVLLERIELGMLCPRGVPLLQSSLLWPFSLTVLPLPHRDSVTEAGCSSNTTAR